MFYILELKKSRSLIFALRMTVLFPVRFDLVHLLFGKSEIMGKFVQDGFSQNPSKGLSCFGHMIKDSRTIDNNDIGQLTGEIVRAFRQGTTTIKSEKITPVGKTDIFECFAVRPIFDLKDNVLDSAAKYRRQASYGSLDGPFKLIAVH